MSDVSDLLERYRRGAELVAVSITGAAGAELDWVPDASKWSIRKIVAHLADAETVATTRFRRVIAEDQPKLEAWDQNLWAERLDYAQRKTSQALESFRRTRAENYELLKGLPSETFDRSGIHSERGPMTLRQLLQVNAEHAESHAAQLRSRRAEYKTFKAGAK